MCCTFLTVGLSEMELFGIFVTQLTEKTKISDQSTVDWPQFDKNFSCNVAIFVINTV